jgi:hypothetical protein
MFEQFEATTPGLKNVLKSRGVGDNALVVAQLIQAATGRSAKGA